MHIKYTKINYTLKTMKNLHSELFCEDFSTEKFTVTGKLHMFITRSAKKLLMYRCQHNQAPRYLTDHCTPISDTVFRQRLRSASSHQVSVPRYRLSTYGRRAFSVAGPTVWNSLPEVMRDPECSVDSYRQSLKTFLFSQY